MSAPAVGLGCRRRLRVRGVVQGVGFRPFVHRLALEMALAGHVGNDTDGVFVEVEGPPAAIDVFERRLYDEAPPLARVDAIESAPIEPCDEHGFRIVESRTASGVTFVAPDAAVCDDCVRELFDPSDRRYRYPFVTCTNCGPRFTITVRLPYDRPNTTMDAFTLCPACAAEYHDPADRRFHAQPLACAALRTGDRVRVRRREDRDGRRRRRRVPARDRGRIGRRGQGSRRVPPRLQRHRRSRALRALRERKGRADKPFAVMVRDLDVAERLARVDGAEAKTLGSSQRPIVLLARDAVMPASRRSWRPATRSSA